MKTIIKSLFLLLLCLPAVSCQDKVGYPEPGPQGNPEKQIEGTYSGIWTRTFNGEATTAPGSITFTPGDRNFVSNVVLNCTDFSLDYTTLANVVNNSAGFVYYNQEAKENGLGATYTGRIIDGVATIKFTINVKEGRVNKLYDYTFTGEK